MKQTIPFTKDIVFSTNIAEVTSISIEESSEVAGDDILSGKFIVAGEYRITDSSVQEEKFEQEIPFDIALDYKYNLDNIVTEITDFKYEIINDDVLRVDIELTIDGILIEEKEEEVFVSMEAKTEEQSIPVQTVNETLEEVTEDTPVSAHIEVTPEIINAEEEIKNAIDMDFETSGCTTYKIYIVREGDSIEDIIEHTGVNKSILEEYNNITELQVLDKLIIPVVKND